ncbi:MAG: hypothetical protein JO217_13060, partial [Acidobacteriaceae bacterium]|nr:hypothetical protein [Acidobacteriaceae bacterium]
MVWPGVTRYCLPPVSITAYIKSLIVAWNSRKVNCLGAIRVCARTSGSGTHFELLHYSESAAQIAAKSAALSCKLLKKFNLSVSLALLLSAISLLPGQENHPIQVSLDITDAPRKILHAELKIPVKPGPLTLFYPKWIPGEHGPTGPVDNLAGLVFTANGQNITWTRDDVN